MQRLVARLRKVRDAFPPEVRLFLLRAFVLFVVWKSLYLFLWQKPRTLDEPLSRSVGRQTAWTLNLLNGTKAFSEREIYKTTVIEGESIRSPMSYVYRDERKVIGIADNCNGLELLVLYMGFILAMPASWQRKAAFGIAGLTIVHGVNVLRCVGLGALMLNMRQYFEFAHHYIFKMFIYGTIFLLWVRFSRHIVLSKSGHAAVQ